eukprot:jgi/Botrbrau1/12526/Bobra.0169s0068.1
MHIICSSPSVRPPASSRLDRGKKPNNARLGFNRRDKLASPETGSESREQSGNVESSGTSSADIHAEWTTLSQDEVHQRLKTVGEVGPRPKFRSAIG